MFLFPPEPQNRRMTPWEKEQEKQEAAIWLRPQREFILDKPFYGWFPPTPVIPKVNFDLYYKP